MDQLQAQWFPVYPSGSGVFMLNGQPSGDINAEAVVSIELDTFPTLIYGARFESTYELPATFWASNPSFKRDMREGGVVDDCEVDIRLTQGNVTTQELAHMRNLQGGLSINKHPWPVFYPVRGGNKVGFRVRRLSSFAPVVVNDVPQPLTVTLKVTLETARGIRNVADGITSPAPPPSTGFP